MNSKIHCRPECTHECKDELDSSRLAVALQDREMLDSTSTERVRVILNEASNERVALQLFSQTQNEKLSQSLRRTWKKG